MVEWTKWIKTHEPHNYKFLGIKLKDKQNMNLMHVIAQNRSVDMFNSLVNNTQDKN